MLVVYPKEVKRNPIEPMTDIEREKIAELDAHQYATASCPYYTREASLILDDFLFLGNRDNATDQDLLERFQIKHVLNVCDLPSEQHILQKFNVVDILLHDEPETDIKQHFDRTNELLHSFYEKKERCLVHCAAGISRSATIVLAYLMKYHHKTLREAHAYLLEKRPQIRPNDGFLVQLIRYEKELIQSKEIPQEEKNHLLTSEANPLETIDEFEQKHHIQEEK